jgi:hypothetical protein
MSTDGDYPGRSKIVLWGIPQRISIYVNAERNENKLNKNMKAGVLYNICFIIHIVCPAQPNIL